MFNVSVSLQLKLLIENTACPNSTPPMAKDATSGKTKVCKNFINNEFR